MRVGHVGSKLPLPYILPHNLEAGTFEPYSLGVFLTFALILFPLAKVWEILSGIKFRLLRNIKGIRLTAQIGQLTSI